MSDKFTEFPINLYDELSIYDPIFVPLGFDPDYLDFILGLSSYEYEDYYELS